MSAPEPTSSAAVAQAAVRPALQRTGTASRLPSPAPPATSAPVIGNQDTDMVLELADGTALRGVSFGAQGKSISGECVFQTGEHPSPRLPD